MVWVVFLFKGYLVLIFLVGKKVFDSWIVNGVVVEWVYYFFGVGSEEVDIFMDSVLINLWVDIFEVQIVQVVVIVIQLVEWIYFGVIEMFGVQI